MSKTDRLTVSLKVKLDTSGLKGELSKIQSFIDKNLKLNIGNQKSLTEVKNFSKEIKGVKFHSGLKTDFKSLINDMTGVSNRAKTLQSDFSALGELAKVDNLTQKFEKLGFSFKRSQKFALGLKGSIAGMGKQALVSFKAMLIQKGIQAATKAVEALVTEYAKLEAQLVKINFVTNNLNMDKVMTSAISVSNKFSLSLMDTLKAMESVGRAYQDLDEGQLALVGSYATLISSVETISSEDAMKGLISVFKAYNMEVESAAAITDGLLEVSRNFSVDVNVLLSGLRKSASAAELAGVSYNDLVGIITAVSEKTGESGETIGNSVKTIVTRLRTNSEALRELEAIGIKLYDPSTGQMKTASTLLFEVSNKWDALSENQKRNLTVAISGQRQISRLVPILKEWNGVVKEASKASQKQGASAELAEARYMSLNGVFGRIKNAFSELTNVIMNDLGIGALLFAIGEVVGMFVRLVSVFFKIFIPLRVLGLLFKTLGWVVGQIGKAFHWLVDIVAMVTDKIMALVKPVADFFSWVGSMFSGLFGGGGSTSEVKVEIDKDKIVQEFREVADSINIVDDSLSQLGSSFRGEDIEKMRKAIDLMQIYSKSAKKGMSDTIAYKSSLITLADVFGISNDELENNIEEYDDYISSLELVMDKEEEFIDLRKQGFGVEEAIGMLVQMEEIKKVQEELIEQEEDRHDSRMEFLKAEKDSFKKNINDQISEIKKFEKSIKFEDKINELTQTKIEIEKELRRLERDNSLESQARRLDLEKELSDNEKQLDKERVDQENNLREENLKNILDKVNEEYDLKIEREKEINEIIKSRIDLLNEGISEGALGEIARLMSVENIEAFVSGFSNALRTNVIPEELRKDEGDVYLNFEIRGETRAEIAENLAKDIFQYTLDKTAITKSVVERKG